MKKACALFGRKKGTAKPQDSAWHISSFVVAKF